MRRRGLDRINPSTRTNARRKVVRELLDVRVGALAHPKDRRSSSAFLSRTALASSAMYR